MAQPGVLAVSIALNNQNGPVTVGALRAWSREHVDAVLSLIVDGMLPEQPHLAEAMAEFPDYRTLSDGEGQMPAVIVAGR